MLICHFYAEQEDRIAENEREVKDAQARQEAAKVAYETICRRMNEVCFTSHVLAIVPDALKLQNMSCKYGHTTSLSLRALIHAVLAVMIRPSFRHEQLPLSGSAGKVLS